jgi:hypothetical protein
MRLVVRRMKRRIRRVVGKELDDATLEALRGDVDELERTINDLSE